MSLMPWENFMREGDWWGWPTPSRIFDQNFGMGMFEPRMGGRGGGQMMPYWMRPGAMATSGAESGMSEVINDKEKFQVNLDVSHFKPEEIKVKMVEKNLMIEGKHEEKMDEHGFISRQFTRKYLLPKDVDPASVVSNLSRDGVLTIQAPKMAIEAPGERTVPIQTAPAKPAVEGKKK